MTQPIVFRRNHRPGVLTSVGGFHDPVGGRGVTTTGRLTVGRRGRAYERVDSVNDTVHAGPAPDPRPGVPDGRCPLS